MMNEIIVDIFFHKLFIHLQDRDQDVLVLQFDFLLKSLFLFTIKPLLPFALIILFVSCQFGLPFL